VKLPDALAEQLRGQKTIRGQAKSWFELLGEYRDYGQFKDTQGDCTVNADLGELVYALLVV
jgi:hypothetical protein